MAEDGCQIRHIDIQLHLTSPADDTPSRLQGQRSRVEWQLADTGKSGVLTGV